MLLIRLVRLKMMLMFMAMLMLNIRLMFMIMLILMEMLMVKRMKIYPMGRSGWKSAVLLAGAETQYCQILYQHYFTF